MDYTILQRPLQNEIWQVNLYLISGHARKLGIMTYIAPHPPEKLIPGDNTISISISMVPRNTNQATEAGHPLIL